ncbi:RxLR effector protein [Phytophthora megakarya]|uniref:RxLR effector protein n=1 Tax=Phytophthora megakarya TaxID=4795 RepID=A0A225WFL3_9STRA|nr:RxLR effector protein [Phytophthora megakarya]
MNKVDDIIKNGPQLTHLTNSIDDYVKYSGEKVSVANKFIETFGTKTYAEMLTKAKETSETTVAATKLQDDLLSQLLKNGDSPDDVAILLGLGRKTKIAGNVNAEALNKYTKDFHTLFNPKSGKTPLEIFKTLQLDKIEDFVSNAKKLSLMDDYLGQFTKMYPNKKTPSMVKLFADSVGDEKLTAMIIKAKQNANQNPEMATFATKLQKEQLNQYLVKMEPPESVYKLLGLTGSKNPTLHVNGPNWVSYKRTYNALYPDVASKKTPIQIFEQLKFDKIDDLVTHSKELNYLADYMDQFAKKYPSKKSPTMVTMFTDAVGDEKLAKMLAAAANNPDTKKMANDMQKVQLSQMLIHGEPQPPKTVFRWMGLARNKNVADESWLHWGWYSKKFKELGFSAR